MSHPHVLSNVGSTLFYISVSFLISLCLQSYICVLPNIRVSDTLWWRGKIASGPNLTWKHGKCLPCLISAQNCPHSPGCGILSRHCVNILLLCLKEVGGKSIYVPSHREENFVDGCKNLKLLWHASNDLNHSYSTFQIMQACMIMMCGDPYL